MEQEQVNPVRFFELMDRVRRAWRNISPCPQLSKSQFATLMVLKHAGKPPLVQFTEEEVERGMSPVSYTHLDVDKRQALD